VDTRRCLAMFAPGGSAFEQTPSQGAHAGNAAVTVGETLPLTGVVLLWIAKAAIRHGTCVVTRAVLVAAFAIQSRNDTCQWKCLADSDCGVPGVCTCEGVC